MNQQFQEVIFWRKMTKSSHPQISFNNVLFLDEKLNFINFIILRKNGQSNEKNRFLKGYAESFPSIFFSQYINHLCNPTQSWLWLMFFYYFTINQTKVCVKKNETIQYNAALAITGAIKGTSQMKLLNELGLESLEFRQWFRKLSAF